MTPDDEGAADAGGGLSRRAVELITAAVLLAFGALLITDASRIGRGWSSDGPQPGFYPFWIGLAMSVVAVVIFVQQWRGGSRQRFIPRGQTRDVLAMLVPSCLYVAAIYLLGFYLASALFLAGFMLRHGSFSPLLVLPIALGVPLLAFLLFELWFKVPLPKGPVEAWLGY